MATDLWLLDLDAEAGDGAEAPGAAAGADADHEWLDDAEHARAAALVDPADRRRYVTAHLALRRLLGEALGAGPGELRILRAPCSACGRPHGRPFLDGGPWFSLSRSGAWAVVAIDAGVPVGVDVEVRQATERLEPLAPQLLGEGEAADDLLQTWVRKEAFLKATGDGLTRPMTSVGAAELASVVDLELPVGLVGALARDMLSAGQDLAPEQAPTRASGPGSR